MRGVLWRLAAVLVVPKRPPIRSITIGSPRFGTPKRTMSATSSVVQSISKDLKKAGIPAKKTWWEKYLKHVISFYGVPMGTIRTIVQKYDVTKAVAWELFRQEMAEQKLAAILILQQLRCQVSDLGELAVLFQQGHIADWNTTDWLCVKVLGELIQSDPEAVTIFQTDWTHSEPLWQKRAALVSFVNHSQHPAVPDIAKNLVSNSSADDRFIMTAIGWVFRNRSEKDPKSVISFLKTYESSLSEEAKNMMTAKMNDGDRKKAGRKGKRKRR